MLAHSHTTKDLLLHERLVLTTALTDAVAGIGSTTPPGVIGHLKSRLDSVEAVLLTLTTNGADHGI